MNPDPIPDLEKKIKNIPKISMVTRVKTNLMASTKFFLFFSLGFIFFNVIPANAQTVYLASELEKLEKLSVSSAYKTESLERMARLYQLSGNSEKALENWLAAVSAEPGKRNDSALLEAVKLLVSLGEFSRAEAELRTILISAQEMEIRQSALNLYAQLEAFKTGDYEPLGILAESQTASLNISGVFYTIWKISGEQNWKNRLLNLYPKSIEAEIVRENSTVKPAYTPLWLLLPAREIPVY